MDEYNRRQFIRTSIPGFLGLGLALPAITALATRANAREGRLPKNSLINWDAFLTFVEKEAAKQHLDRWKEKAYVRRVSRLFKQLNLKDPALAQAFENAQQGLGNKRVDFYDLEEQRNFEVCLLQFEENEEIKHHNHPDMTGVILCATGKIDVWNYDLLGGSEKEEACETVENDEKPPEKKRVLLAETGQATLMKGSVSTLTSKARNIHRLKARQLTQLVDIFAPPYDKERIQKSDWYDVDSEPQEERHGEHKVFEATVS